MTKIQEKIFDNTSQKILNLWPRQCKKPVCRFEGGKLVCGTKSLHQTPAARMWRTWLRIKNT